MSAILEGGVTRKTKNTTKKLAESSIFICYFLTCFTTGFTSV